MKATIDENNNEICITLETNKEKQFINDMEYKNMEYVIDYIECIEGHVHLVIKFSETSH